MVRGPLVCSRGAGPSSASPWQVPPSVSRRDLERYRRMARELRRPHVVPHERAESVSSGGAAADPVS